jgi:hypothetical protein
MLLLLGIAVSLCSCGVFLVLQRTLHNPAIFTEYWKNISQQEWVQAYSSWQAKQTAYTDGLGISILAAMGFGGALAISWFPRAALALSFAGVNFLFAWTSHVYLTVWPPMGNFIINQMTAQDKFFWDLVDLRYGGSTLQVADMETLALLVTVLVLTYLFTLNLGRWKACLRSLQIMGLSFMTIGLEIFDFDASEFNLHATQLQASYGVLVWFSNADLLYLGTAIFVATSLLFYRASLPNWGLVARARRLPGLQTLQRARPAEAHEEG